MKYINQRNTSHLDMMVIGQGHTIMLGNVPEILNTTDSINKLNENFFAWKGTNQESVQKFGFWSDIDYNTYYPDLKAEDLKPNEEEFINPMFRLLSATIVSKNYNPTDFSQPGVLKDSMPLLLGQTVNCDHSTDIGNAIGSVSSVSWQEAYKADNGFIIPAGINGVLKIDGKANPRIARGILMDPPSIHSNSVTVQFRWDKSHPEMDDRDFYEKLGTYDSKGNMIRKMVTEVVRYLETSLVSHGADTFAQKIGDNGKIINPEFAKRTWNSYSEYMEDDKRIYCFSDAKQIFSESQTSDNTSGNNNINSDSFTNNKDNMNEELKKFLEKLFGKNMLTLKEGKEATQEEAISLIQDLVKGHKDLSDQITALTAEKDSLSEKVTNLTAENASLKENAEIGKAHIATLRDSVIANYKKVSGDKFDEKDPVYVMLSDTSTKGQVLENLNKVYQERLEEMFPLTCKHCGSKDVSRASSYEKFEDPTAKGINNNTEDKTLEEVSTHDAVKNICSRKLKYKGYDSED